MRVRGDHDLGLVQWANKTWAHGRGLGTEVSLADYKRDLTVEVFNDAGQTALRYSISAAGSRR